jgi:hypothetical protein
MILSGQQFTNDGYVQGMGCFSQGKDGKVSPIMTQQIIAVDAHMNTPN